MDYKELEQAMADLDEDTVLDMMKEVMDNNGDCLLYTSDAADEL
mgnify:CR=1 FL=1